MRLAVLAAILVAAPVLAASEAETSAQAISLCKAAIAAKEPTAAVRFMSGNFKSRSAKLDFALRTENGERRSAKCRVSHKDKAVSDLTIG